MPFENTPDRWLNKLFVPNEDTHKYVRGHAVVLAGDMTGATRLVSYAARRMGAGLVTVACTEDQKIVFQNDLPGNIVQVYNAENRFTPHLLDARKNAFSFGAAGLCGEEGRSIVLNTLKLGPKKAVVLDAGALTAFEEDHEALLDAIHSNCVITPHKGEFHRLFPDLVDEMDDSTLALAAAKRAGCTVVLKGHTTMIASPEGELVENKHTSAWLATAGTGDVLSGFVLGLLAQGVPAFEAAQAAVWLHGDAAQRFGGAGLIAEDLPDILPESLQELLS